jgi:hypothetical protein
LTASLGEEELNERAGWLPLASVILAFIGESHPKIMYNTEDKIKFYRSSLLVVQLVKHVFRQHFILMLLE